MFLFRIFLCLWIVMNYTNVSLAHMEKEASKPSHKVHLRHQAHQAKLNLNSATVKELMRVKGISAYRAHAIVAYRKKQGEFKTLDELSHVRGFKQVKASELDKIQSQLTLDVDKS